MVAKERVGARVKKTYDQARTPYQRVLESAPVSDEIKMMLRQQYATLNPVAVLQQMRRLQTVFWKFAVGEPPVQPADVSTSS